MKKTFSYLKPYTGSILLSFVTVILSTLGSLMLPTLLADVINIGVGRGDMSFVYASAVKMLGVVALASGMSVVTGYLSTRTAAGFGRDLRKAVFEKIQTFSTYEFDKFESSSLITRNTNDITQVQTFADMFLRIIITSPVMMIGGIIMAFSKSPELARVIAITLPIMIILIFAVSKSIIPITRQMQKNIDRVNLVMREKLTGARVIRAFNNEELSEERFSEASERLRVSSLKMSRVMGTLMPLMQLILNFTTIGVVYIGMSVVNNPGNMVLAGDVMATIQYVMQIMISMLMLTMVFFMLPRAVASAGRVSEVLTSVPTITDRPDAVIESTFPGSLEFDNVTFYYPGSEEPALQNVSFKANPGEVTAVIGSTGSGKSTLANLILRFYDTDEGAVRVGGVDVRDYAVHELRKKIGYAPQKALLFSGTVSENIAYGTELIESEILSAADIARAHDFIVTKETGYESRVARGGSNFSGGQKQRLSMARAVARNPEIYIFDDSFSALDFKTEKELRERLSAKTADASVLIIAQRVFSIMDAHTILVLDAGRIVGKGTHDELMASSDVYREIVNSQLSEKEV